MYILLLFVVLPKFEVKVNLPDYALEKDKYIHGSVDVKWVPYLKRTSANLKQLELKYFRDKYVLNQSGPVTSLKIGTFLLVYIYM